MTAFCKLHTPWPRPLRPMYLWMYLLSGYSCTRPPDTAKHYRESFFDSATQVKNSGRYRQAFALVDSVYAGFDRISLADKYRYYLFKYQVFSDHYSGGQSSDSCVRYADSMLILLEKNNLQASLPREYANANAYKGIEYTDQKKYEEAFRYLSVSKFIAEEISDSSLIANYDSQLALILYRQGRMRKAAALFIESLSKISGSPDNGEKFYKIQGWYNSIGLCYLQSGSPDSAVYYFEKALSYITDNSHLPGVDHKFSEIALGIVSGNLAQASEAKNDTARAITLYRRDIAINSQPGYDHEDANVARVFLAQLFLKCGKKDSAWRLLREVQPHLGTIDEESRLSWLQVMWKYMDARPDKVKAGQYRLSYLLLSDSLATKSRSLLRTNADEAYQRLNNQNRLELMARQDKIKNSYLIVFVLLGILSATLLVFVFRQWWILRYHVRKLLSINQLVARQHIQVVKTLSALQKSQEDNTRMMKIVAHDLRGPVGGIATYTHLLLEHRLDTHKQNEVLGLMQQAANNSLALIGDLLTIHPVGQDLVQEAVNISDLLQYCIDLATGNAAAKKQRIVFSPEPASARGDREKLWRVFDNLLSNAIKFSPENTVIHVDMRVQGDKVSILIRDQGIGIPDEIKNTLFTISQDHRRKGTAGEPSNGLGLFICKQIIEAHGGKIGDESEPGKGSIFFVELVLYK